MAPSLTTASAWLLFSMMQLWSLPGADGHAFLSRPKSRQVVHGKGPKFGGSGDGSMGGAGNVQNLNAGIGGGVDGRAQETAVGHSLCGDMPSRKGFMAGSAYGPSAATIQGPYKAGGIMDIEVTVTAHHEGWFEMRLCEERKPATGADFGPETAVTQECFNKHVLKFDVAYTKAQHNGEMLRGRTDPSDYGPSAVAGWSKARDETICTSDFDGLTRDKWGGAEPGIDGFPDGPAGSCCNGGGNCSPATANTDRWVLPRSNAGGSGSSGKGEVFSMRYFLPEGVTCERCVLQMQYITGNSNNQYPETFWNCADIKIESCATPAECDAIREAREANEELSSATAGTTTETVPVPVRPVETGGSRASGAGGGASVSTGRCASQPSCRGCLWEAHSACYADWSEATCRSYETQGYAWCGGGTAGTTAAPVTAAPVTAAPVTAGGGNACAKSFESCGGIGHTGPSCCASGSSCVVQSQWWHQCLPTGRRLRGGLA